MIIRHDIDPCLYLENSEQFPAVIQLHNSLKNEVLICDDMAILIHPEWLLTAAHCIDDNTPLQHS